MLYLLISVSLSICLTYGSILDFMRPKRPEWLANFVRCPMCLGFWVGGLISFFTEYGLTVWYFDCFIVAFLGFIVDVWYDTRYPPLEPIENVENKEECLCETCMSLCRGFPQYRTCKGYVQRTVKDNVYNAIETVLEYNQDNDTLDNSPGSDLDSLLRMLRDKLEG